MVGICREVAEPLEPAPDLCFDDEGLAGFRIKAGVEVRRGKRRRFDKKRQGESMVILIALAS